MSAPPEEELLTGPRLPRWLPWGGGGALAAVVIIFLAVHLTNAAPSDSPTSAPPTDSSASAGPATLVPPPVTVDDEPVRLPVADPPSDIVAAGKSAFALVGNSVIRIEANGYTAAVVDGLDLAVARDARLELDADEHRVWIVPMGMPNPVLRAYDTRTLAPIGTEHRKATITDAAALDGAVYVADRDGLTRVTLAGAARTFAGWGSRVFAVAADPSRHRLVATVDRQQRVELAAYGTGGSASFARAPKGLVKGQLVVAGSGAIWLAGYALDGAMLVRLDTGLQHVLATSALADSLSPGAEVLASGTNSLLVHAAGSTSELWCTSAQTGAIAQSWQIVASRAASAHGSAYALGDTGLLRLSLAGHCTG